MIGPTTSGFDRLGLALDVERRKRGRLESGARALDGNGRRDDLAGLGLAHEAGGEVHAVADHRVHTPIRGTEVAREHAAGVDAGFERKDAGGVDDAARRGEHPRLVVTGAPRCAGDDDHLGAVLADVRRQQRHVVGHDRVLARIDEVGDGGGERLGTLSREQIIGALHLDERHGDVAMLRFDAPFEQVVTQGRAHGVTQIDVVAHR